MNPFTFQNKISTKKTNPENENTVALLVQTFQHKQHQFHFQNLTLKKFVKYAKYRGIIIFRNHCLHIKKCKSIGKANSK